MDAHMDTCDYLGMFSAKRRDTKKDFFVSREFKEIYTGLLIKALSNYFLKNEKYSFWAITATLFTIFARSLVKQTVLQWVV